MQHRLPPPPRNTPLGLLAGIVLAALLLVGGVLAWLAWQWTIFTVAHPALADTLRGAGFIAAALLAAATPVFVGVIVWRRWATHRYIEAHHVTQVIRARTQPAPNAHSFTYHNAPRIKAAQPVELEPLALPDPAPPSVPTFAHLLDSGRIDTSMRTMILGFDAQTSEVVEGSWNDLYSAGLGGLQGSGKTRAAAFLLAQSALMGGRLVICDPNPGTTDSLSTLVAPLGAAFLSSLGIVSDPRDILTALRHAKDKLDTRKREGRSPFNICICVDEWLALRRGALADELPALVEAFSTEGRKYEVNAMLLAQRWDKAIAGDFRNTLASAYIFRMRRQEAAMLTGMGADTLPADTLALAKGECYLLDTHGTARRVWIPHLTPQDMVRVGSMLDNLYRPPIGFAVPKPVGVVPSALLSAQAHADSKRTANGQQTDSKANSKNTAPESSKPLSPDQARAVGLFFEGKRLPDIVREVRGIDPATAGRPGRRATDEVFDLIRRAMMGE